MTVGAGFPPFRCKFSDIFWSLSATTVIGTKSVGLAPDISNLNGFMAAAGYVDASVILGLGDPPFVQRGWATAEVIVSRA
jgi:hypothetical protein